MVFSPGFIENKSTKPPVRLYAT